MSSTSAVTIAVHGGAFHADDCFGCALLTLLHPEATIIRGPDKEQLAAATFALDTGLVYDHAVRRYDHHQREFSEKRANGIALSSFGLLWRHYGNTLLTQLSASLPVVLDEQGLQALFERMDKLLVEPVDAIDNGVFYQGIKEDFRHLGLRSLDLFDVLDSFRPAGEGEEGFDAAFLDAVALCRTLLQQFAKHAAKWIAQRGDFSKAMLLACEAKSQYLDLPHNGNLRDFFFSALEGEMAVPGFSAQQVVQHSSALLYAVYPKQREGKSQWYVEALPLSRADMRNRRNLPSSWGGLTGLALIEASGVPDAGFCHKGLFLCNAQSREGALALLHKALAT